MASRKLAGAIAAMCCIVGLLIGLAIIDPQILIDSKELVFLAVGAIAALGGWQIQKQAQVDAANGTPPTFHTKTNGG